MRPIRSRTTSETCSSWYSRDVVKPLLDGWIKKAQASSVPEIVVLDAKILRHADNTLKTIELGLNNARIKAFNNKIKLVIRVQNHAEPA